MAQNELESPLSPSLIFDICDNVFFPEPLRSSEVSSCSGGGSGCCYDDNSYTDLCFSSFPSDVANFTDPTSKTNTTSVRSVLLDSNPDGDLDAPASVNFPPNFSILSKAAPNQQEQLDVSALHSQIQLPDIANFSGFSSCSLDSISAIPPPQVLPPVFKEDSLCAMQSYACMDPTSPLSCSLLNHTGMGSLYGGNLNMGMAAVAEEASAIISSQELEFLGNNVGTYRSESVYSSGELQVLNENQQQLAVSGSGSSTVPLTRDMSTLEESSFKVGRLSAEERKEKIHRYMKKRNERNFSKKIKYACRKTLADSRPRVRGRFAKNEEFVEAARTSFRHYEDEDDEEVGVKDEEEMIDSSDIFAHISGVNSFRCSYPIQSWM